MALPDPHRSRAVLVGISDYAHADLPAMPAADAGAGHLARLLRDPLVWGLPQEHVTVLGAGTTGERILTAVRDAALATQDTLVVYFAGHGLRDPGERLHLALADADPDYPQIGTLPYRQLRDLIRHAGHRARHRVTVLDCCYSGIAGGMSGAGAPTRDDLAAALDEHTHAAAAGGSETERHGAAGDGYGDCVLASAPAQSRSFVRPGAQFPEFTGELITALEAGITGAGPTISLEHVWLRVHDRMRGRDSPEPQLFTQNNATRHIHFHNRAPHQHSEQSTTAPDPDPGPSANTRSARNADDRREGFATGSDNAEGTQQPSRSNSPFTISWTGKEPLRTYSDPRPRRVRTILSAALSAVAVACGIPLMVKGPESQNAAIGGVWLILLGICIFMPLLATRPEKSAWSLKVGPKGIKTTKYGAGREYRWDQVQAFAIEEVVSGTYRCSAGLHVKFTKSGKSRHLRRPPGWPYKQDALRHNGMIPVCVFGPMTERQRAALTEALTRYGHGRSGRRSLRWPSPPRTRA